MNEFEFYFSFYGLLLGLSAATVLTRFADVIGEREDRKKVGWLSPLLGMFVLLDLSSFWIWAWRARETFTISYSQVYLGLFVAGAFFFSASLVFPARQRVDSFDEHYWSHKRMVLVGIMLANSILLLHAAFVRPEVFNFGFFIEYSAYWPVLIALLFTKNRVVDLALLFWLCIYYVGGSVIFGW